MSINKDIFNVVRDENPVNLVIFDNFFPNVKTGFRVAEFNSYIDSFDHVSIFSANPDFDSIYKEYCTYFPNNKDNVFKLDSLTEEDLKNCDVFYTVFIDNAILYLKYFEYAKKPFIFTLYPGGIFYLNYPVCDNNLRRVFGSKFFYKVIVTQKITYDYLVNNKFLPEDKIEFVYGGTFSKPTKTVTKKLYKKDKETFDICFVAAKYSPKGIGKGYDFFIEVCKKLAEFNDIRFHVVGGFESSDIDVSELGDRIKFYGLKNPDFFPEFYSNMDIILCPNRPFAEYYGAFDGFPTGCCIDAAFNGTAVFCTDILNQNICFENEKDIVLIDLDLNKVANKIIYYFNNLDLLYKLSEEGKEKFDEVFDLDNQMKKRIEIINSAKNHFS